MESKCKQCENISQEENIYEIQIIHKEGGGRFLCSWVATAFGKQENPINGKYFSAPLSSKDSPVELNLQAEIKRKFDSMLRPNSELERTAFDNLAVKRRVLIPIDGKV